MMPCAAGRQASFGGRWIIPCPAVIVRHVLHSEGLPEPLRFCDRHMNQLIAAGLVPHVNVSDDDVGRLAAYYLQHPDGPGPGW
jgi:hypothetical protein